MSVILAGFIGGAGEGLVKVAEDKKKAMLRDEQRARDNAELERRRKANADALAALYGPSSVSGGGGRMGLDVGGDPAMEAGFNKAQRIHGGNHSFKGLGNLNDYKGDNLGFDTGNPVAEEAAPGTLAGALARVEAGGYDTLFGNSEQKGGKFAGVTVSSKSLGELYDFTDPKNEYGQWVKQANPEKVLATPLGKGQIVGTTLRRVAKEMNLPPDTIFSPDVQNQMIAYLAMQRIQKGGTMAQMRKGLRNEWAGFSKISNRELDQIIKNLQSGVTGFEGGSFGASYQMSDGSLPMRRGLANPSGQPNAGLSLDRLAEIAANPDVDASIRKAAVSQMERTKSPSGGKITGKEWLPAGDGKEVLAGFNEQGQAVPRTMGGKPIIRDKSQKESGLTGNIWVPYGDGQEALAGTNKEGEVVLRLRDGKEVVRNAKSQDVKLSASLDTRLGRRFKTRADDPDFQVIDAVKGEILRVMQNEGLNETQAEQKVLKAMVFEEEVTTGAGWFDGPKETKTVRNRRGEGEFTGLFNYDKAKPKATPSVPADPKTPEDRPQSKPAKSRGQAPVVSKAEYADLPSGAQFIAADDPDQIVRVKP